MKHKQKVALDPEVIDRIVVSQANDGSAWDPPLSAHRSKAASLALPRELASRAAFFARLHRSTSVAEWVAGIIKERLDIEEAAFGVVKRGIKSRCKA